MHGSTYKGIALIVMGLILLWHSDLARAVDPLAYACEDGACGSGNGNWFELLIFLAFIFFGAIFGSPSTKVMLGITFTPPILLAFIFGRTWFMSFIPMFFVCLFIHEKAMAVFGLDGDKVKEISGAEKADNHLAAFIPTLVPIPASMAPERIEFDKLTIKDSQSQLPREEIFTSDALDKHAAVDIENFGPDLCDMVREVANLTVREKLVTESQIRTVISELLTPLIEIWGERIIETTMIMASKVLIFDQCNQKSLDSSTYVDLDDIAVLYIDDAERDELESRYGIDLLLLIAKYAHQECKVIAKNLSETISTAPERTVQQITQTMPVSQLVESAVKSPGLAVAAIVELHRRAKEEAQTPAEVAHLFKLAAQINKRLRSQQPQSSQPNAAPLSNDVIAEPVPPEYQEQAPATVEIDVQHDPDDHDALDIENFGLDMCDMIREVADFTVRGHLAPTSLGRDSTSERLRRFLEEWGESLISAVIEVTAKVIKHNQGAVPGITEADDAETLTPEQLYVNDPAEFSLLESEFGEDLVLVFLKYAEQEYGRTARKLPAAEPPGPQSRSHIRKDNFGTAFNNPKLERFFETGEL